MPIKNKMKIKNLDDLFTLKLKALYDIEAEVIKSLPKLTKKAFKPELKAAFSEHLVETKEQVKRLEKIFSLLDIKPSKTKVEAIRGLAKDIEWIIKQKPTKTALDAALIASAEYVEHYEIAGYQSLRDWAMLLGMNEAIELIEETLAEEKSAATKLNILANNNINEKALAV